MAFITLVPSVKRPVLFLISGYALKIMPTKYTFSGGKKGSTINVNFSSKSHYPLQMLPNASNIFCPCHIRLDYCRELTWIISVVKN